MGWRSFILGASVPIRPHPVRCRAVRCTWQGPSWLPCVTSPTELTGGSACSVRFRVRRRENFE